MRVNLGSGQAYMPGWVNVDASPNVRADVRLDAIEFVRRHGAEVQELYMGHFLEHLMPVDVASLLRLIAERLPQGAEVSAVTPDIRAVMDAYLRNEIDNVRLNAAFVYSYVQPSHHLWCYDTESLRDAFQAAGFTDVAAIDPTSWPPVFWKEGPESLYQCGVRGRVGRVAHGERPSFPGVVPPPMYGAADTPVEDVTDVGMTAEEMLLDRMRRYRERVATLEARVIELELVELELAELGRRSEVLRASHEAVHRSWSMRVGLRATAAANMVLPRGTRRRAAVARLARAAVPRRSSGAA